MKSQKVLAVFGLVIGMSFVLLIPGSAAAQYGDGGMGSGGTGSGSSTGVYTAPPGGYSSKTGIGIGVGAAAGAGVLYLASRHRGSVTGCVEQANDGLALVDAKNKQTYSLTLNGADLKSGERVVLKGKKLKDSTGAQVFEAKKIVKNLGACSP